MDEDLQGWFREEYAWLADEPTIEVLWRNTDLGVGAAEQNEKPEKRESEKGAE